MLRLSKMLRHRGPDWNGIHSFRNCILAHERLSINGLHSGTPCSIIRHPQNNYFFVAIILLQQFSIIFKVHSQLQTVIRALPSL